MNAVLSIVLVLIVKQLDFVLCKPKATPQDEQPDYAQMEETRQEMPAEEAVVNPQPPPAHPHHHHRAHKARQAEPETRAAPQPEATQTNVENERNPERTDGKQFYCLLGPPVCDWYCRRCNFNRGECTWKWLTCTCIN